MRSATTRTRRRVQAAAAAALVLASAAGAQRWSRYADEDRGRLFSLPRSQDDIYEWKQAKADLEAGRTALAVERLHKLRATGRPGVVPLDEVGESFRGLHTAVLMTLRDLDGEAREAYEQLTRLEAGRLLRTAFVGARPEQLKTLAEGFAGSHPGIRARLRLGDLALESGDGITAEFHYRAALDSMPSKSEQRSQAAARMWAAQVVAGGLSHATPETPALRRVSDEVSLALPRLTNSRAMWTAYGGGGNGRGQMTSPLGNLRLQQRIDLEPNGYRGRSYPMHAVGDLSGIIVNDGVSISCYDPLSGQMIWETPGPLADAPHELEKYLRAVNRDTVLAAACNADVVVGALHVPGAGQNTRYRNIDVIRHIPRRKLFAVDRATGKRLWSHWDHLDGPIASRFEGHDAAGPPLIYGDTVYVPSHDQTGAVSYYLTAYDLHTGNTRWRQLVCSSQGEVNMFGNSRREYTASPLAVADGMLVGTTNLGVCFAADAATGSLRWVTAYEVIPLPETRLTDQQDRRVLFANNPAVVTDGVVACTPLDSAYAIAFDIETGRMLWRMYHRSPTQRSNDIHWLLGSQGDEFLFSGLGVVAVQARPKSSSGQPAVRRVRSAESLGLPSDTMISPRTIPRGAISEELIYYTSPAGLRVFDQKGDAAVPKLAAGSEALGNLLLVDGILVSLRDSQLDFYYDRERLIRAARERVRLDRDDIGALLRLASLVRGGAAGDTSSAASEQTEKLLREGLQVAARTGISQRAPIYRRIAGELFRLGEQRARDLRAEQPRAALELMRRTRDEALQPEEWLQAQDTILSWVQKDRASYLTELALMSERHGAHLHRFPDQRPVPVAAYSLWQSATHTLDPKAAVGFSQQLIDRFPDVILDGKPAGEIASDRQFELITGHGAAVYTAIEQRAQAELVASGDDPERLTKLSSMFPHSDAARKALAMVMDHAMATDDFSAAARCYARAAARGHADASITRRMVAAALTAGNRPLAAQLAERLVATHPNATSDFKPDRGQPMSEALAATPSLNRYTPPQLERPIGLIARKESGAATLGLRLCEIEVADGFASPASVPVLVSVDGRRLEAFDPADGRAMFDRLLFSSPFQYQEGEALLLCSDTLVLPELDRVRGVDAQTGELKWAISDGQDRMLVNLGTQGGVLHLFSELRDAGDGGALLGIEPLTGTVLFRHEFPVTAESTAPASSGGGLWVFRAGTGDASSELRRFDAITGQLSHRITLDEPLLKRLGLENRQIRSWAAHLLHKTLFADDRHVYLPLDGSDRTPPRVAAVDYKGRERWLWRGMRDREIPMVAQRGDEIVILERGIRGSRLVILNRNSGALRRERQLGSALSIRNWSRTERSRQAPNPLLLVDHGPNLQIDLTCYFLEGSSGSFRHSLHGRHEHVVWEPLITEDFVAIAARRRDDAQLALFVLNPDTRKSVLPDRKNYLRIPGNPPFKMLAAPPYIAVQHAGGISVLGELQESDK